jgi:hypothetical protein
MAAGDAALMALVRAIVGDAAAALRLLAGSPALASARFEVGATREAAKAYYLDAIQHYVYAGDTALHIAAAAYRREIVRKLIAMGADVPSRCTMPWTACRARMRGIRARRRLRSPP